MVTYIFAKIKGIHFCILYRYLFYEFILRRWTRRTRLLSKLYKRDRQLTSKNSWLVDLWGEWCGLLLG